MITMSSIRIRNLDDLVIENLKKDAAANGISVNEQAIRTLTQAFMPMDFLSSLDKSDQKYPAPKRRRN
jgi:plasmid stability protein